jgi:hypothetical protein
VILISSTITPLISHWGSAFITDGQFDDDRGYIFSYAETGLEVSTTKKTAFMIRLSPSVSNALIGDLGERELLNRAQLLLQGIEITSDSEDASGNIIRGGIVVEGILNPQNYPEDPSNVRWSALSGVAQGGQPSFAQIAGGGGITWTSGNTSTTASATALSPVSVSLIADRFNSDSNFSVTESSFENNGPVLIGSTLGGTNRDGDRIWFPGTIIRRIRDRGNRYEIDASRRADSGHFNGDQITATIGQDLTNTNFAFFDKTSFDSTGASVGTAVTGGSVSFPANTLINDISLLDHGGTKFYQVIFNSSFDGTLQAGTGTVEFTFEQPPHAQPGETVFSYIANPGERSTLELDSLKELTNTPLGGRGTYPNGPDVLAVNVYKVTGNETNGNIILKWGEAQA